MGRLVEQKGVDLLTSVMQEWAAHQNAQWVILGTGDPKYQDQIATFAQRSPHRIAARFTFCESQAHKIEAAADMLLMPSRFKPCGLSQMYSLKYGTVPIVRATGGLSDTITDATDEAIATGTPNGFSFREYSPLAFSETLSRACNAYARPETWRKIVTVGMGQDWSWQRVAREYAALYQRMKTARRPVASA